jgi:hypothetical protein
MTMSWIRKEAQRRGLSIETVALELVRKGIAVSQTAPFHDLDELVGTWTKEQTEEFLDAIADVEQVDEKLGQ